LKQVILIPYCAFVCCRSFEADAIAGTGVNNDLCNGQPVRMRYVLNFEIINFKDNIGSDTLTSNTAVTNRGRNLLGNSPIISKLLRCRSYKDTVSYFTPFRSCCASALTHQLLSACLLRCDQSGSFAAIHVVESRTLNYCILFNLVNKWNSLAAA
jgi:hypothetical protein